MKRFLSTLLLISYALTATAADTVVTTDKLKLGVKANTTATKTIEFEKGAGSANPKLRWNNTTSKIEFSNDGTTFSGFVESEGTAPTLAANYGLSLSVAASALTVALKTNAGTDPSSSDIAYFSFNSGTSGSTGTFTRRSVTAANSITIPSGTTIGVSGARPIYVYAVDTGSGVVLGLSTSSGFDEGLQQTTTAISGGSTAGVLYTTSAQTSKFVRLIGKFDYSAAGGTWSGGSIGVVSIGKVKPVPSFAAKTANYTLTDADSIITVDGTSSAFTITLPDAATMKPGKAFEIIRLDNTLANAISFATTSSQTIGGVAPAGRGLFTPGEDWVLVSDGANWQVRNHKSDTDWFTCTVANPTSSGSAIFTITAATVSGGDVYSNNGQTFTVSINSSSTTMTTAASGAPAASGTLTKVSGNAGSAATVTFSAVTNAKPARGSNTIANDTVTCARRGRKILIHRYFRQTAASGATAGTGDWVEYTPTGVTLDTSTTTGCGLFANTTAANSYLEDLPNSILSSTNDCRSQGIITSAAMYWNGATAVPMGPNTYRMHGMLNVSTVDYPHTIGQVNYTTAAWVWNVTNELYVLGWDQ